MKNTGSVSITGPEDVRQREDEVVKIVFSYAVVGLLLVATFWPAQNEAADEYAQGKKLYSDKCLICHDAKGDGNGPAGSALSPKPANFTDPKFWQGDVDKKIKDTVVNGHGCRSRQASSTAERFLIILGAWYRVLPMPPATISSWTTQTSAIQTIPNWRVRISFMA